MKMFTKFVFASLMVAFVLGTVVSPVMTPAFAAAQSTDQPADQEQQKPPADNGSAHSGHHG
ncbi:hypothetical protein AXX12_15020 [Anaerosporomusa subterranea]|uniref:Uncharacterized protein n=1 Tax=Anaerosporomusa subterranea TaxID=1794912 RepID=A0A154BLW4_ANASB|nr:hypothetical protein [Anaerosporomusa subterranea]KYZ74891.1 hypothetical protein AXX12_15020 [Anaerosporomusa subterranea]